MTLSHFLVVFFLATSKTANPHRDTLHRKLVGFIGD
jgi:hypothetical protein